MPLRSLRIAIIGSSFSGTLTASILQKFGFENVHLFDKSSSLKQHTPLVVPVNGAYLLDKLLLLQHEIRQHTTTIRNYVQYNKRLEIIENYQPSKLMKFKTQSQSFSIDKSILVEILSKSLSMPKHFSAELKGLKPIEHKGNLQFALEFPNQILSNNDNNFDLIIGADGPSSKVRSLVFGERKERRFNGILLEGITNFTQSGLKLDESISEVWSSGIRVGFVPIHLHGEKKLFWYASVNEGLACQDITISQLCVLLKNNSFASLIINLLTNSQMHSSRVIDYPPKRDAIANESIALVGSALALPTMDYHQASVLAIEDAVSLGFHLKYNENLSIALENYAGLRYKRVANVVESAALETQTSLEKSRFMSSLREMAAAWMPKEAKNAAQSSIYEYELLKEFGEPQEF